MKGIKSKAVLERKLSVFDIDEGFASKLEQVLGMQPLPTLQFEAAVKVADAAVRFKANVAGM